VSFVFNVCFSLVLQLSRLGIDKHSQITQKTNSLPNKAQWPSEAPGYIQIVVDWALLHISLVMKVTQTIINQQ